MGNSSRAETISRWSVFLLFFLTPFFFIPVPWVSVAQSKLLIAVVLATIGSLAWIAKSLSESEFRIPKSPLLIAALLVPVAYCISALATGASWAAFIGSGAGQDTVMGFTLWYIALLLSAAVLGSQEKRVVLALRLLMAGALIVLAVQLVHLIIPTFAFGGALAFPAASIVGSWHDLGIFLAFILFLSLALLRTSVFEGYWYYIVIIAGVVSAAFLVIINFSDIWLGLLGIALFCALVLFLARAPNSGRAGLKNAFLWVLFAVLALGMYFGGNVIQGNLPTSLQVTQIEVRPSWTGTFAVGREVFTEPTQIFFGSGPNTFPREWGRFKPLSVNATQFWNTDFNYGVGFIPTSFVTTGILGLIAWIAVCGALLWSAMRLLRDLQNLSVVRAALTAGALFFTAFHILYVPGPALSLLTFLLFGALMAEEASAGAISRSAMSLSWSTWKGRFAATLLSLAGAVFFFGGVQSARALLSDMLVNRAVVEFEASGSVEKASRSVSLGLGILPSSDRAHRAGVELGMIQLTALAGSSTAQSKLQSTLNETIQHGLSAVEIESRDYQNWLTLARLYGELAGAGIQGAEQEARTAYGQASANNPTNPLPHLGLAQLDLLKGDDAAARVNLEAAIAIKPDLVTAHYLLSQVLARANNLDTALQHAGAVVQIAQQDALGWYNLGTILYAKSDYGNAALAFEQAAGIQNNYANAVFLLGLSYYRLDREDDALRALRAVQNANPADSTLADIIKKIEADQDPFAAPAEQ